MRAPVLHESRARTSLQCKMGPAHCLKAYIRHAAIIFAWRRRSCVCYSCMLMRLFCTTGLTLTPASASPTRAVPQLPARMALPMAALSEAPEGAHGRNSCPSRVRTFRYNRPSTISYKSAVLIIPSMVTRLNILGRDLRSCRIFLRLVSSDAYGRCHW